MFCIYLRNQNSIASTLKQRVFWSILISVQSVEPHLGISFWTHRSHCSNKYIKKKYKNKINNKLCLISLFTRAHKCSTCSFIESLHVLSFKYHVNEQWNLKFFKLASFICFCFRFTICKSGPSLTLRDDMNYRWLRISKCNLSGCFSLRKILVTEYCFAYLSKFRNFRFFGTLRVHNKPVYGTISGTCDLIISNFPCQWSFMINMKCATFVYLNTCV